MDSCTETKTPEFLKTLMDWVNDSDRFSARAHVQITDLTQDGFSRGELAVVPENFNPMDIVHGGALATLADTVSGMGVIAATGHSCVTVSYGMNFLRPAVGSKITCTAQPEKLGGRICVMRAELFDDQGKKVAGGNFTFCVMKPMDEVMREVEEKRKGCC